MNKPAGKPAPAAAEPAPGHNRPPRSPIETLTDEFQYVDTAITQFEALVAHETTPQVIEDDEDLCVTDGRIEKASSILKRLDVLSAERKALVESLFIGFVNRVVECKKTLEARRDRYLAKKEEAEKQNWCFEITNANIVDLNILRPYLTIANIEQAIRAYIKAGRHLVAGTSTVLVGETREGGIPGVRIFDDKKGTYR